MPNEQLKQKEILEFISKNNFPFVIKKELYEPLLQNSKISVDQFMLLLIKIVKEKAEPRISHYKVGAVGLTSDNSIVLGVNVEFSNIPLNNTIHAEQFVVILTSHEKLGHLKKIAVTAPPCGHCRQWLNETYNADKIQVITPDSEAMSLKSLLPNSFGPKDLGISGELLSPTRNKYQPNSTDESLQTKMANVAMQSYTPYTNSPSSIGLILNDSSLITGYYIENAAFNPSISPIHSAIVKLISLSKSTNEIKKIILLENFDSKLSQVSVIDSLKDSLNQNISVERIDLKSIVSKK